MLEQVINKKVFYTENQGQNVWNKVNKSNEIGQEQKTLITASA